MHKSGHFLKTTSVERETNLQAAKYRTRKDAAGTFNQNLYFSSLSGASYFKKAAEEGGAGGVEFLCECVLQRARRAF